LFRKYFNSCVITAHLHGQLVAQKWSKVSQTSAHGKMRLWVGW